MTSQKQRKPKTVFTPDHKLEYAKLMEWQKTHPELFTQNRYKQSNLDVFE